MKPITLIGILCCMATLCTAQVYQSDLKNGKYRNPVLYADYSDPDVVRVGADYLLTASSFNSVPGLPVLWSRDMISWTIVSHALPYSLPGTTGHTPEYGNCVWAPAIRYHEGYVYIFYGDPDRGIYYVRSPYQPSEGNAAPQFDWEEAVFLLPGKGYIDPCPLWDEDGRVYMSYALAGSRAGLKSVILMCELQPDLSGVKVPGRIIFDGHSDFGADYRVDEGNYWTPGVNHPTCEGTKLYKRDGYYYLMHPAGGVPTGWQTVQRSRSIYGPYEARVVMAQGESAVNGPHQGAWVETAEGEHWFFHFQDVGAHGRLVLLQPMTWQTDGWPVIGVDKDGDGIGQPVEIHKKPAIRLRGQQVFGPQESDEMDGMELGLQWQWTANPDASWYFCDAAHGLLRLYSVYANPAEKSAHEFPYPNMLLQKTTAPAFTVTARVRFCPSDKYKADKSEKAGLVVTGLKSHLLEAEPNGEWMYLRVVYRMVPKTLKPGDTDQDIRCRFYASKDGTHFRAVGEEFPAVEGKWIGSKWGFVCTRPVSGKNDGGWLDIDWVRVTK